MDMDTKKMNKKRIILMLLSCYMEPISIREFYVKVDHWRLDNFKLNIKRTNIEQIFKSKEVTKKDNKYIIDNLLTREKYFIDLFNTEKELFKEFSKLIIPESSYYNYGYENHRASTAARFELYKNEYIIRVYHNENFYNYLNSILQGFLNKEIDFSSNKEDLLKIFITILWYNISHFKNIDKDLELIKTFPEYGKLFIDKEYSFILIYNLFMKGEFEELLKLNKKLYYKNSIEPTVFIGMIELIKGNYDRAIFIFRQELRKIRKNSKLSNPLLHGEMHSLAFILSILKYPKFYTPLHNSYYQINKEGPNHLWLRNLYLTYIKNETLETKKILFINNNYLGIETITEMISYSWLNVIEDWDFVSMTKVEKVANIALKNGFNWVAIELSYILKESVNNPNKWRKIYNKLQKTMPELIPIASMLEFKNQKTLIFDLIENEINLKLENQISEQKKERILWLLEEDYNENLYLEANYQKVLKSGKWSVAKSVSYQNLEDKHTSFLSINDLIVSKNHENKYYNTNFDLSQIAGTLTKMNNIFNAYDLQNNIIFKKAKFPITIYDTENDYRVDIKFDKIKKYNLLKENDYFYKAVTLNEHTIKLLNELKKSNIIFKKEEKDILLKWIKNNKTLDITASFYVPKGLSPKIIKPKLKVIFEIEFDDGVFYINTKISPSPNWDLYTIHKKGITIAHKDSENNYLLLKREPKKEQNIIDYVFNKLKLNLKLDDNYSFKTKSNNKIIKILKKSEKIKELEIRWIKKGKKTKLKTISSNHVNWKIKNKNNWFEIEGSINFDNNEQILLNELLKEGKNKTFFTLKNGDIVTLTDELKKNLKEIENSTINKNNKMIIPPFFASEMNEILEIGRILEKSDEWTKNLESFRQFSDNEVKIPPKMEIILRNYQKTGVKWISKMTNSGFGVCLADDMGLGKTIQAIIAIAMAPEKSIVIAPASVLYNWKLEFEKFAPQLKPIIYEGKVNENIFKNLTKKSIIIVSYDKFQRDSEFFYKYSWGFVVLDEAQMIKNAVTKRAKAIFELKSEKRIALSGTPIENHLGELWSLYHFLNPVLLGSQQMFKDFFVKPILEHDIETKEMLKKMLDPFLLRRLKKDVLKELPDKTEIIHLINFEDKEKIHYEAFRRKALKDMDGNTDKSGVQRIKILAHLTKLRQASCDMSLIGKKNDESAKTKESSRLVKDIISSGHKVLVFSQFTSYLDIIKNKFNEEKINFLYLDGSTTKKKRQELVNQFQANNDIKVFLISLRAGGTGLNLTAANYVIHLDPWWNPAVEDQATDRTHRIGQSKSVTVYKMIVKNSIEEKIIKLHESKKDLSNSILDNMDKVNTKLSIDDLMALL